MENQYVSESLRIANDITQLVKIDLKDEMNRQILASYIFGVLNAKAIQESISPIDVQITMIRVGIEALGYSPEAATQMTQFVIDATDKNFHPTAYAIIHRGIEAFYLYSNEKYEQLKEDFDNIMASIK